MRPAPWNGWPSYSRPSPPSRPLRLPARLAARSRGRISFEHVRFRYSSRPEHYALHDFSLDVQSGETVAIVGPSGAGKSTSLQLLLRFYDPEKGRICIDGIDIASLDPQELRRQIGLVPQETMLFGASARENIATGGRERAMRRSRPQPVPRPPTSFLRALPEGYDTFLGERGTRLSG